MRRKLDLLPQPPPPPVSAAIGGGIGETNGVGSSSMTSSPTKGNLNPSLLIISLILMAVFFFSVLLHLLLRYLSRSSSTTTTVSSGDHNVASADHSHHAPRISSRRVSPEYQSLIDSLPLFSFDSVTGLKSSSTVDCAVCLSKLEPHDKLRLLPLCCHAFHAQCIDTWLASSHTCPLCRSTICVNESEELAKLSSLSASGGDSFRLEIGSISRRNSAAADSGSVPNSRRSYSIGSFEYVVEDDSEVMVAGSIHRQGGSDNNLGRKDINGVASPAAVNVAGPEPPGDHVAAEVASGGRSWLKDYVDRLASSASTSFSSRTQSFRYSGRIFTGSSRRSGDNAVAGFGEVGSWDLEGNWVSEEMGGFFRWLSGV
ncbi:E3 ubiquitin-protein ligase ATL4-like isoform X2 [Telopea speciosissima]|uniref:E3 ubiquitin-protein ligase ATL4-like isoform X2 n=1 Tax=Telopea speciosissima TaxID=54955 RepID=UPI001CC82FF9|nr:E3 ubiquitin-protein ligase ATL4-like isoform X2 [Telopea speciosissima]